MSEQVPQPQEPQETPSSDTQRSLSLQHRRGTTKKGTRRKRQALTKPDARPRRHYSARERVLLLDTWERSGLTAGEFASLCDVSKHTLYLWKKRFAQSGPAGLQDNPRKSARNLIPEATRRAVLMLKRTHPEWGCQRLHDMLLRAEGYSVSPGSIRKILLEDGYEAEVVPGCKHPDKPRRFERARPNELWQTDLFTFTLKRLCRRVHLVGFMDDHSRFIVGIGLHASANGAMVREAFLSAIGRFGAPEEVLTDNGPQYASWRGKSAFSKLTEKLGIRQILSRPRRPQTLGKIERWWSTLWTECLEKAIFRDIDDARARLGLFVDYYNFHRPHQGIAGLVPADRFFEASSEVRKTLEREVDKNSLDLARHGIPRKPFYLTGKLGDKGISLHAEGERVILTQADGTRSEVDLGSTGRRAKAGDPETLPKPATSMSPFESGSLSMPLETTWPPPGPALPPPGTSNLDRVLEVLPPSAPGLGSNEEAEA